MYDCFNLGEGREAFVSGAAFKGMTLIVSHVFMNGFLFFSLFVCLSIFE